ncbi:hypothetical protein K461DRAFT_290357 [Myriangium duriaei CBS 260.36]|uniref:IMS import disulfide relay-system CHCH-CHCH-like Cx9C domain-containing protein n=1 Tax=Myriangium duriaei CBS 260.36 TaxID=1168546 RepID=A0A9P4JA48_9PEZI|nr:hypothetical protein K461DRAFT_290357 [Myriangium duriaei CBS 260.36]
MPGRTSPLEKFSQAISKCAAEGATYGKCVASEYQNVRKDMCLQEFMRLKECYLKTAGRKR